MTTRIGFSTPKKFNPVSWLVRKLTGSQVSHAFFVYMDSDWGEDFVMEAHELGFRIVSLEKFKKANNILRLIIPKKSIDEGTRRVALEYVGTRYDYEELFGMIVVVVGRWLKAKWKNPFRSTSKVFCSEAVVRAMLLSPGYETISLDTDTDPQELLTWFNTYEGS